ncbi:carbamoyltransferase HypF [Streptacidiphilus anmyonensis]|uniref:carbamoyltransferase HypF n=1 Tax=Streptacidiphilus anmyonensis TaxID=405782 RepID=UPI0005A70725|nr:carbamoyltransferase HypF [Streptacidiphilus anmyonensis]
MTAPTAAPAERRRVTVQGVVQGVGFRPYVFGLASELRLTGYVTNTAEGVVAEVEGAGGAVAAFCARLAAEAPPLAVVQSVSDEPVALRGDAAFTIEASQAGGARRTLVSPDTATCDACLAELRDPDDRRHRHPFVTCTHCGPRFTIVTGLPYDRANTTMAGFPMCPQCAREYQDPADRRFHAQPVACHACGPRLRLLVAGVDGPVERTGDPVVATRRLLAQGAIVAVKGLGGYHLACDAANGRAVRELRQRKARGAKPFALMVADLDEIAPLVRIGAEERALLTGARRPIVLLRRRRGPDGPARALVADAVAPGSPDLGVMLPYTPVHHLLLGLPGDSAAPRLLVMTSGNLGGEPIVTDEADALVRLGGLADAWLTHDRPIHVPCDDSVVRVVDGEELLVRRSRGYAPFPVALPFAVTPTLAVGGDLKNAFCLGRDRHAWLSAHIGDMDDLATVAAFEGAERQLESISGVAPERLAADRHPAYRSAAWAHRNAAGRPLRTVQHHHAHIASVLAENGWETDAGPVLGVAFDGTGYGEDGTVWGGEVLLADYDGFHRLAHLAEAPLPGGDAAVHRPYRMALAHLHAAGLPWTPGLPCVDACADDERRVLARQLERGLNCVPTSSAGRLFDAVSALAGVCQHAHYEAQAAIELEAAACAWDGPEPQPYRFALRPVPDAPLRIDAAPVLRAVVADVTAGVDARLVAARFHAGLAAAVQEVCRRLRGQTGVGTVALSGGVFANALLLTACLRGLREDGFTVLRHRLVPPNDGGLALGQLAVAARP